MRFLASYIMQGRIQAMVVASTLAFISLFIPPVSVVSSATVALVTLRRGAIDGLTILIISCLATAVLGYIKFGNFQFVLMYGLILWLPVWLISIVLREGRHLAVAVEIAVALGMLGVLGFYLIYPEPVQLWHSVLTQLLQPMLDSGADIPLEQVQNQIKVLSHIMTGAIAAGMVYSMLFGLFLGRWWQALLYNPGGFRTEFLSLRTHKPLAIATIVILLMAVLLSGTVAEICWNLVVLLFVLYTITGTAAIHEAFARMKQARFLVPFLYVTLFLVPQVAIAVALFGVGDTWLDLRNKISNQGNR